MIVRKIDENGFYIEDVEVFPDESGNYNLTDGLIEFSWNEPLYKPKWNGTEWVEGATQEEIDNINGVDLPKVPTLEERLAALESAMLAQLGLGGE